MKKKIQIDRLNEVAEGVDIILPFMKAEIDEKIIVDLVGHNIPSFTGDFQKSESLYTKSGSRLYLLGLGESKHKSHVHEAFLKLAFDNRENWQDSIQVLTNHLSEETINASILGIQMATYDIGFLKSEQKDNRFFDKDFKISIVNNTSLSLDLNESQVTGEVINSVKKLVDTPSNYKTPEFLANWAQDSAKLYGYDCKVLGKSDLEEQGLHAVLSVGQGSVNEPKLIITTYNPQGTSNPDISLIGKGITFDTGGLSIKPSQNMHYMKSDMGGASVVLGTVELAARLKLPVHVVGIVASAENAVDALSMRPGDVIQSYSGKSIEVIDTDAEGRLVLADAIAYTLKNHQPKQMIDLATLTGSVVRTFGYEVAGMFTKNSEMAATLEEIGYNTHERIWPLPLFEDYDADLHSDVADVRNFSNKPIAGAINAAKFLEFFTEKHEHWLHLDIAGVSLKDSPYSKMKSATGFGIRLITEYLKTLKN